MSDVLKVFICCLCFLFQWPVWAQPPERAGVKSDSRVEVCESLKPFLGSFVLKKWGHQYAPLPVFAIGVQNLRVDDPLYSPRVFVGMVAKDVATCNLNVYYERNNLEGAGFSLCDGLGKLTPLDPLRITVEKSGPTTLFQCHYRYSEKRGPLAGQQVCFGQEQLKFSVSPHGQLLNIEKRWLKDSCAGEQDKVSLSLRQGPADLNVE